MNKPLIGKDTDEYRAQMKAMGPPEQSRCNGPKGCDILSEVPEEECNRCIKEHGAYEYT